MRLLGHCPPLDGLRGIAVALIVCFHFAGHYVLHGATISLDIFFALSGFLITVLLLDEKRLTGRIDLRGFYVRRAARLLPALLLMLGVWTVLLLLFHDQGWMGSTPAGDGSGSAVPVVGALKDVLSALLYAANWDVVLGGSDAPLQHLWSLAVEEQFYAVWPLALLALLAVPLRARLAVLSAAIALGIGWALVLWESGAGGNRLYFGTDTRAPSLLLGALGALVWHRRRALGARARLSATRAWAGIAAFVVILTHLHEGVWKYAVLPAVVAACTLQVIALVAEKPRSPLGRLLSVAPLTWLGRRSYALYLWHYLWATWTHGLEPAVGIPLGIAGALACTVASWHLVEAPALAWAARRRAKAEPVPEARPVRVAA